MTGARVAALVVGLVALVGERLVVGRVVRVLARLGGARGRAGRRRIRASLSGAAGAAPGHVVAAPATRASRAPGAGLGTLDGVDEHAYRRTPAMTAVLVVLVVAGVAAIAWGVVLEVQTQRPEQWLGLALWLALALVLHDGLFVPIATATGALARRLAQRAAPAITAVVKAALIVGGVVTLAVVPEIWAKDAGTANPTVLVRDYGAALGVFWLALAVVTALAVVAVYLRVRRQNVRPSMLQD